MSGRDLVRRCYFCSSPDALQFQYHPEWFQDEEDEEASDDWADANRKKIIGLQRNSGSQICHCRMGMMKERQKVAEAEEIKQLFQNNPSLLLTT